MPPNVMNDFKYPNLEVLELAGNAAHDIIVVILIIKWFIVNKN